MKKIINRIKTALKRARYNLLTKTKTIHTFWKIKRTCAIPLKRMCIPMAGVIRIYGDDDITVFAIRFNDAIADAKRESHNVFGEEAVFILKNGIKIWNSEQKHNKIC